MTKHSRREFLSRALSGGLVAGAGLAALEPLLGRAANARLAPAVGQSKRSYTAGKFGMELDGQFAGWVESVEGGHAVADVVVEKLGSDSIQHKHIAGVKYEDVTVNCGTGMSKGFYEWIKASCDRQPLRKNAAILTCDYDYNIKSRIEVFNALLTEVAFPACDASLKDAARMTIKFAPESTRETAFTGAGPRYQGSQIYKGAQKRWVPSNFRLKIDGLDCTKVRSIDAVTARLGSSPIQISTERLGLSTAARPSLSSLVINLPESRELNLWYEDFVIRGNTGQTKERAGTLEYLTPDLKESIFLLSFHNVGISKMTKPQMQPGSASSGLVKVEMYYGDVGLAYNPALLS